VRKKRPELWKKKSWILRQDNMPAHNALMVKQFLAGKCIPVLEHPPYAQELAPCDFSLFPKLRSALKGIHLQSVDEVKPKMADLLSKVSDNDPQHCFEQWKIHMQRYIDGGEGMVKRVAINLYDFENKPDFSHQSRQLHTSSFWYGHCFHLLMKCPNKFLQFIFCISFSLLVLLS
jgi:hypothetical protein